MPDGFLLKSVVFKLISKEISRAEHEYMNIHPPINALGTALIMSAVKRGDIIGRIITLQSIRYDGHYADCHDSYKLRVTGCNYTDVPNADWTRLLVHEGPNGTILLESHRYRNHYVDAHHSGEIHLTHSLNPPTTYATGPGGEW